MIVPPTTCFAGSADPALQRIPNEVLVSLSSYQVALLRGALEPANGHAIDLRASLPLLRRRYYLTLLAGRERRSHDRLAREGQLAWSRQLPVYLLLLSILVTLMVGGIVILYVIKCALGINLMTRPSPLHFIYEALWGA